MEKSSNQNDYPYQTSSFPKLEEYIKTIPNIDKFKQNKSLIEYDIIHSEDPVRQLIPKKLKGDVKFADLRESKAVAAFCSVAVGDSLGSFMELVDTNYDRNYIKGFDNIDEAMEKGESKGARCKKGQYTDDTGMSLCIADSLLLNNRKYDGKDLRHRFHHWWYSAYNNGKKNDKDENGWKSFGIGRALRKSIKELIKDPSERVSGCDGEGQDNGNGSIMRIVAIPIAFKNDLEACLKYAKEQSYCTHNGDEAAECSKLLAYVCWQFLNSDSVEKCREILENLGKNYKSELYSVQCIAESKVEEESKLKEYDSQFNASIKDRTWTWKDPDYRYSPTRQQLRPNLCGIYCMDAVCMSLHILYHTDSWRKALLKAVNLGGDADTVGAITEMLAGYMYGWNDDLRDDYLKYVTQWDEYKCAIRAQKLYDM